MNRDSATSIPATHVWIPIGAAVFTVALIVSALVVPQLRLLHILQALIYVAVVILARRGSMWGVGAGVTIAVAWNSLNLFVTHNMQRGAVVFWSFLRTGEIGALLQAPAGTLPGLVPVMVLLGGIGHFILIAACLAALFDRRINDKRMWKMVAGGVVVLAYFALIIIVAAPR
jgi:hypothetical protein